MSKAAVGQNRIQMGTTAYLVNLNQSAQLTHYLPTLNEYNYHQALQNQAERVRNTIAGIYSDLKTHEGVLRYVPSVRRASLSNLVERLEQVCKLAAYDSGNAWACRSLLAQTGLAGMSRSSATTSDLERAAALMQRGGESGLDKYSRVATVKEAVKYSESFAIGNDESKRVFLAELTKGQFSGFLADLWDYYNYRENPGDYCGSNGREICSEAYVSDKERQAFPGFTSSARMQIDYAGPIKQGLYDVFRQIVQDTVDTRLGRDYMTDEDGERLRAAVHALRACGIAAEASLESRIEQLCWYTPVNPATVLQLQKTLNQMGMGFNLKEDGVYGVETSNAWAAFLEHLASAEIPALVSKGVTAADVSLQSIGIGHALYQNMHSFNPLLGPLPRNTLISIGIPIPDGYIMIPIQRLNTDTRYVQIPDQAYRFLQRFRSSGKVVKIGGRFVLAADIVLDALELGSTIASDLNDADGKLGRATLRTTFSIGGKWLGTIAGAKIGTVLGAKFAAFSFVASVPAGAVALPLVGAAVFAIGGGAVVGALGEWVIDITATGE